MASSSSSSSAPAFSSQSWKYHVFLSFRGEDTRKTFADHLYSALEQQGINTYKDDVTLPRGESIRPSLLKAIEESQIAVVVFSQNYADSSWCLDELACIMKCKDTKGQIVMPIFYNVEPSQVRKQKRKYGEAFATHELENNTKVESWRKALTVVSNISGWETKHIAEGHESKVIKEIVDTISQRLQLVTSSENEKLVGIAARMQRLKSELQIGSRCVRMIGIWGVGGGGKTTLASSIYDEISSNFDGCCFVKNIREESSRNGLESLQEQILSGVLKQKQVHVIRRVEEGRRMIRDRLCRRKVLIVLDDVDQLDQLQALAGSHDWYGEGSRIIITTRDEHVLNANRVDVKHNISLLNNDEAIKLFRKHAYRDCTPMDDYEQLSKEVVSYAGGLPLALTVIGSFLCDKNIHEWRSALARLKEIPNDNILETLKISYDGLTKVEKELFLDIACFFSSRGKDAAIEVLDACGFHPVIGVKVLIQKALITVSEDGFFNMHDLVKEMGHHIVRGEHPKNPEKHSRVWKMEDILKICDMDAKTELDKIEAICISVTSSFPEAEEEEVLPPIAPNMKNLRYIEWTGDLANPMRNNFPRRELCCLILYSGLQEQLWEGYKFLPNLKMMKLNFLDNLIMTPDFDGLPNLEKFMLIECASIEEVHPSIGRLERLVLLSIKHCQSVKMFPPLTGPKNLETLRLPGCNKLFNLSEIQHRNMDNLPHLRLDDNSGKECSLEEPFLPYNNMNHIRIRFFHNLQYLSLRKLNLCYCNLGDDFIGSHVWQLPNLQKLDLKGNNFSQLSFSHVGLPRLKFLSVTNCDHLVELLELPSSIAVVEAENCKSLKSFGDISNCKWLWKVSLLRGYKVDPLDGETLLDSMLQERAFEDHFISVALAHQIPKRFVGSFFRRSIFACLHHGRRYTYTLRLVHNWYADFRGFLIRVVGKSTWVGYIDIVIKQEEDEEDSRFEVWQETNEASEPNYDGEVQTYVGYVSFSSLRRITSLNSSYNIISFSGNSYENSFAAELVPIRSKYDSVQITEISKDSSEYWDKVYKKTFKIQHDSKSSIKISWRPYP